MIMTHKNARSPHSDITASLQIKNTIIGAAQRWVGSGQNLAIEQQTGIGRQLCLGLGNVERSWLSLVKRGR